jgi:hypothetical protein
MNTLFDSSMFTYDVIISHGPGCSDGITAAWCFWRKLPREYRELLAKEGGLYSKPEANANEENSSDKASDPYIHPNSPEGAMALQNKGFPIVFVFLQPQEEVPVKLVENKRVIILDLDMGDSLVNVVTYARSVLLSDHHDSTPITINKHASFLLEQSRDKFAMYIVTNKSESGASLAWRLTHSAVIPNFVHIVRIGDTWQWHEYPTLHARFVLRALHIRRAFRSFPDIEATFIHWDENFATNVQKGRAVLESETALIKQIAKQCDIGFIQTNDGRVYTVAYTQCNILHSEVGSSMKWYAQKRFKIPIHFCATWKYVSYKGLICVSMRDGEQGINLASIAREIKGCNGKGGGHAEAAAFSFYGLEKFHDFIMKSSPISQHSQTISNSLENFVTPTLKEDLSYKTI